MFIKTFKIKKSIFVLLISVGLQTSLLAIDTNATNDFYSLKSKNYNSNAYVEGLSTYSAYPYSPNYNLGGYSLTFKGTNYLGAGGGGGYMGTQNVTVTNASKIIFANNSRLILGNGAGTNSSNIDFKNQLQMGSGSKIEVRQKSTLTLNSNIIGDPNAEIILNGGTIGIAGGKAIVKGSSFSSTAKFNLAGSAVLSGETLDVRQVTGKVNISSIEALRGNVYANKDFNVDNFTIKTTTAAPITDLHGTIDTVFNIGTVSIASGSTGTINGTAKFNTGKEVKINIANIGGYSVLDTSSIEKTTIGTLNSSYATVKAKNLIVNNATFSNNETYLYANTIVSNNTISLNNKAKLYLKSGQSFNANEFNMSNGSILYAQIGGNGGMTGTTEIKNIIFNNSQIYANNLITHNINVQNNASVFLGNRNSYINQGDLNVSDGSWLQINGGDFINNGKINITMGDGNATDFIKVINGSFTFDMTLTTETAQLQNAGIMETKEVKVPKAQINVTLNPAGLQSGKSYNILTTANGILFKNGTVVYKKTDEGYSNYVKALEKRVNFKTIDNSTIAITYKMSGDNKTLSFMYDTGKRYIDVSPFIRPGTWVLGIGSGTAAFGSIGGIPGASGLVKDYTLKLRPQEFHNSISGATENAIYYLQNLDYNNYGSTSAKFTIDATSSNFALGKNEDIGGTGGTINIGRFNAKSTMILKADNIFLGGTINLGDRALISGHLSLETTGGNGQIASNNANSVINVNNHSSFKAIGTSFNYNGTINLNGNKTVTDEVGFDLSRISGNIKINTLNATAARPNSIDGNAGIKMKNFTISNLNVYKGNNIYSDFTNNISTSNITNLTLESGGSTADRSELRFSGGGEKLTIAKLSVLNWAVFDASTITQTTITQTINLPYSKATFNDLTLESGAIMNYGGSTDLAIKQNLVSHGSIVINPNGSALKSIKVTKNAELYFNHTQKSVITISDIRGLKLNQFYTILETTTGEITYHYTSEEGVQTSSKGDTKNGNGLYDEFADKITFFNGNSELKSVDKVVNNKKISFKIDVASLSNPYDPNDIRYWFYRKGGKIWVDKINATGSSVMDWLQILMIDKHNGLWANQRILSNDLNYFLRIGRQLESTMGQLSSVNRKNNSTVAVNLATDVNKSNRLVKLSNTRSKNPSFAQMLESLQNKHFATTKNDVISLYKSTTREPYKNNVWANGIGAASFVNGGNSTLYGVNIGYDRFVNNVIIGGYLAYAQGQYNGDIIRNDSKNANIGLYSRAYTGRAEFDLSASETIGFNKEEIYSQNIILSDLNQNYRYNTYTTNINFSYGYLFDIAHKSIILKPQIGASYYYIAATSISGKVADSRNEDIAIKTNPDHKQNVSLNLAIETRQYLSRSSYWYFMAGVSRDLFLKSKDEGVRFVGNGTLSYKKGDNLNTYASLTAGGEIELFKRVFVNLGLGAKAGLAYKDININGNIGIRYIF